MNTNYHYAVLSDIGQIRQKNEDHLGAFPEHNLYIVADGIGGMPAGEVASMLIIEVLPELICQRLPDIDKLDSDEITQRLQQAIIDLSNRIVQESQNKPSYAGMGSTLVLCLFTEQNSFIAHLGDSRAYRFCDGQLTQITEDHTLIQHLVRSGAVSAEQAQHHCARNQLVQYIGMSGVPSPTVMCLPRAKEERWLLCSDGLSDMLVEQQIEQLLAQQSSPKNTCQSLVDAANDAGGKDNVSVIVIDR